MHALLRMIPLLILPSCTPATVPEALGTLERERVLLRATATEVITQLPVAEGDQVSCGQLLVQFDQRKQRSRVDLAKAEVAGAKAYLARLHHGERPEDIATAKANVSQALAEQHQAERHYHRTEQLTAAKLISAAERDSARAQYDSATAALAAAQQQLDKLHHGSRAEDIRRAAATLTAANAKLALEQQLLDELSVTASRSGRLDSLPYHVGDHVPVQAVVAAIETDQRPFARVYIPAPYMTRLQLGMQLPVRIDGLASPLTGTLRWLSHEPAFTPYFALNEQDRSRLVYLAELDLDAAADALPSGLVVQAELPSLSTKEAHKHE